MIFLLWVISAIGIAGCIVAAALIVVLMWAFRRVDSMRDGNLQSGENLPQIIDSCLITANRNHRLGIDCRKAMEAACDQGNILQKTKFSAYYLALMPNGSIYTVKKVSWSNKTLHPGNSAKFGKEIDTIGKLSNSNIMVPLAYALTTESAYLIYEDMHEGTVWNHLHKGTGSVLDWSSRYSIALGIAQGMAFLHDCKPQVILLDLSTKTIMLKSLKEPQISDIELSKVIDPSKSIESPPILAGSVGYIPPEYAYTMKLTTAGNVYSCGVVLLELLTGKPPVCNGTELAKWASRYSPRIEEVEKIIDRRIYTTSLSVLSQAALVLKIALDCVNYSPNARPEMKTVVGSLLQAR